MYLFSGFKVLLFVILVVSLPISRSLVLLILIYLQSRLLAQDVRL